MDNKVLPEPIQFQPLVRFSDIIGGFILLSTVVPDTSAATAANYGVFFTAPFALEILEVWESHKTAGSDASAVTLDIEKLTSGQALDNGRALMSTTFNLKSTADTPVRQKVVTTTGTAGNKTFDRILEVGDRLALKDAGVLTAVAHVAVTVLLKPVQAQVQLA